MITDPCIDLFPETSLAPLVRLEHIAKYFPFPRGRVIPEGMVVPEECWYLENADTGIMLVPEKWLVPEKLWCQQRSGASKILVPEKL
jgi:hypothetical protein